MVNTLFMTQDPPAFDETKNVLVERDLNNN